jgi:hypothetical protein
VTDFWWKRHDTFPAIQVQLLDAVGVPVNVAGATVKFIMKLDGGVGVVVNAPATIVNGPSGIVSYTPLAADTATAGSYTAEWQITFSGGGKQTFPDPGFNTILITADLDDA